MKFPVALATAVLLSSSAQSAEPPAPDGPGEFTPLPRARSYALDVKRTELVVRTFKEGVASRFAHDHVVRANAFFGSVFFDEDNPSNSHISITVRADRLVIDNTKARLRYGAMGRVSDSDLEAITKSMHSEEQLWTSRYKFMTFKSTSVTQNADLTYLIEGDLTIRGETRRIKLTMHADVRDGQFTAVGKTRLKHSDFGYPPYEALFGAIKVRDDFILHLRVVGS